MTQRISTAETARSGILLALLLLFQYLGFFVGNKPLVACLVNFILAFSAFTLRLNIAVILAIISPAAAFALGIGPKFPVFIPAVMLANAVFVFFCNLSYNKFNLFILRILGCSAGALVKFLILWFFVSSLLPYFIVLSENERHLLVLMYSFPQFITAFLGAFLALIFAGFMRRTGLKGEDRRC